MLFGCRELHIYTDHKNLTSNKLVSQKIMCWRLFIEEFHPTFHYVQGSENIIADALSRLLSLEGQNMVVQPSSPGAMKKPLGGSKFRLARTTHTFRLASVGLIRDTRQAQMRRMRHSDMRFPWPRTTMTCWNVY